VDLSEEVEMLAKIWEQSIAERGDDFTHSYIKLFRDYQDCADIALTEERVSVSGAKATWIQLRTASPDTFFYYEKDNSESDKVDQAKCRLRLI
jgi:hypothetical protein